MDNPRGQLVPPAPPCPPPHPLLRSAPLPPPAPPRVPWRGCWRGGSITWLLPPPLGPEQREVPVGPEPAQQQRQQGPSRQRQAQRAPPRHRRRTAAHPHGAPLSGAAPAARSQRRPPPRLPPAFPSLPFPSSPVPSLPFPSPLRCAGPRSPQGCGDKRRLCGAEAERAAAGEGRLLPAERFVSPACRAPEGSQGCPAFPR